MNKSKLNYRPDIDGLRAVAVLSVVIFHAFPNALPGGFTGVDIFFVISGYLISGIIYSSLDAEKFSFFEFYERRIRRIFPALILTLIMVIGAGYYYLLIDEFEELGKHVAASGVFIQNIVFLKESGYFDKASDLKPLLHLWSLAVEEQFYIFFPPIIILLWRIKKNLPLILSVVIVISFIANLWVSQKNIEAAFFLTNYRCWELLAGSLLALIKFTKSGNRCFSNVCSMIGFSLIIFCMIALNNGDPYPSWRALYPVIGTVLLIYAGPQACINKWILSNQVAVWVGLISYPLYLFHWPMFSFLKILDIKENEFLYKFVALIISFLLAILTYYYIESRVRYSRSKLTTLVLIGLFILTGVLGALIWNNIISPRSSAMGFDDIVEAYNDVKYFNGADSKGKKIGTSSYLHESERGSIKTLYLGDSHMQQCAPRVLELYNRKETGERGYVFFTRGGLVPIPNVYDNTGVPYDEYIPKMLELSKREDVDRIVISANWMHYFVWAANKHKINSIKLNDALGAKEAFRSLEDTMKEFTKTGKKVYIINNIPIHGGFHPKKLIKRYINGDIKINATPLSITMYRKMKGEKNQGFYNQGEIYDMISEVARRVNARIIDPMQVLNENGNCKIIQDGMPIYRDGYHLRASYVKDYSKYLDETIIP
jgi:peptidoglycan/LPS O-acetylase OafA/YrhL